MPAGTDTYETHKIKLSAEILRAGGSVRLRVLGTSMLPSIWPGDVISIDGRAIASVRSGDIVLYEANDGFFVHRLVEKLGIENQAYWITRGDAMPQSDPAVPESHLLGYVSSICRSGRTLNPKPRLTPLMRAAGWVLCRSDSLRSVALRLQSFRMRPKSNTLAHFARYF